MCRNRRTAFLLVISWKCDILRGNYGNNLSSCCASGRVYFGGSRLCARVSVSAHTCPLLSGEGVSLSVQGQAGCGSWGAAAEQSRSGSPSRPGVRQPQRWNGVRSRLLALQRGQLEARVRTSLLFQFDMRLGFFVLFWGEGLKG